MADQPEKRSKRQVKDPETFRERAIKATATSDKPKKATRLRGMGRAVGAPIFQPIGRIYRALATIQPFKFIFKVFSLIGKILVPVYLRNSWKELRLVSWPSWKQSRQLTSAVLIFAIIFGALIATVDYGLDKLFKSILLK